MSEHVFSKNTTLVVACLLLCACCESSFIINEKGKKKEDYVMKQKSVCIYAKYKQNGEEILIVCQKMVLDLYFKQQKD